MPAAISAQQEKTVVTDISSWIGWQPNQAIEYFGAPKSVYAVRGDKEGLDSVVFYYVDHSYFFFWQDRLWQVRFDKRYVGDLFGIHMGMKLKDVKSQLGQARKEDGASLFYDLPDKGYPVRLRLVFEAGALSDVYIYRGDF